MTLKSESAKGNFGINNALRIYKKRLIKHYKVYFPIRTELVINRNNPNSNKASTTIAVFCNINQRI